MVSTVDSYHQGWGSNLVSGLCDCGFYIHPVVPGLIGIPKCALLLVGSPVMSSRWICLYIYNLLFLCFLL